MKKLTGEPNNKYFLTQREARRHVAFRGGEADLPIITPTRMHPLYATQRLRLTRGRRLMQTLRMAHRYHL